MMHAICTCITPPPPDHRPFTTEHYYLFPPFLSRVYNKICAQLSQFLNSLCKFFPLILVANSMYMSPCSISLRSRNLCWFSPLLLNVQCHANQCSLSLYTLLPLVRINTVTHTVLSQSLRSNRFFSQHTFLFQATFLLCDTCTRFTGK